ncbi:MAG: hypothetical protein SWK76_09850 [Actinomycetota bacterium]|nr:hypothetical protein [Actinomycetota bacterium]
MAVETAMERKGLIDATERILRELMHTPKFKESLIILLSNIDPPAARGLVRTLFWEDPGVLLSFFGALPDLINVGGEAMAEMVAQMNSLPEPLLRDFLNKVISGIDGKSWGEAIVGLATMPLGLDEENNALKQGLEALGRDFKEGYGQSAGEEVFLPWLNGWMERKAAEAKDKESTTHIFIREASKAMKNNPEFVEHVLRPILGPATSPPRKKSTAKSGQADKVKRSEEG